MQLTANPEYPSYTCPECGTAFVVYRHHLNGSLCRALMRIGQVEGPALLRNLNLDNSQYTNFIHLLYWGLVSPVLNENNAHKRGCYLVTPRGREFLALRLAVPRTAVVRSGRVLGFEGALVRLDQIVDGYKWHGDYAAEKRDGLESENLEEL
jgi:hypothetical protein